jgi:hypothetical protein
MLATERRWLSFWTVALILLFIPSLLVAGDRAVQKNGAKSSSNETVEMFQAIKDGQIAVKFIPKSSLQANVMIENKTDKPLNVKLPEAFAGVPVLAQFGGGGLAGGGSRSSSRNSGGGNQSMGGGMGMGGMGMGGMGMGMMNVAPEKVGQIKVNTVCLEHGKAEPRPSVPYEIKPIESAAVKAGVKELCQMLGEGKIDQRAAQAAAWHLNNGLSWQELAAKVGKKHLNGTTEPYFNPQELQAAVAVAQNVLKIAAENEKQKKSSAKGSEHKSTSASE